MKKIAGIISRSLDVHFSEEDQAKYSRNEMRKIALVNYIALIAIVNMLSYVILYSILDFPLFKPAILFLTLASIPIVGIIFINKKGKHLLAKILVCTFNAFNMSYIAIVAFEKEPEFQVYLLLGAIIPIFLWSYKQRTYPIIIISLILGVYGFIEFFPPLFEAQIILPENYIHGFRLSNVFICFLAVAAAIGFYQFLYRKQEELLHQQAEQLKISQQHKDLIYSIIAHDIRSPFGNLAGLAEVLKEKYEKY